MEGHTERFHRVLVLWLDLNKAMAQTKPAGHAHRHSHSGPWNSEDAKVHEAWHKLTAPGNLMELEHWLCQSAEGKPAEWARKALQVCRERQEKK
jgi:hypothetical protein